MLFLLPATHFEALNPEQALVIKVMRHGNVHCVQVSPESFTGPKRGEFTSSHGKATDRWHLS